MNRSAGPGLRGSRSGSDRNGYVLRRAEALERRRGGRSSGEVGTTVVGGILLFVGRHVAKVRLHRGDIRLVLCICELGNRDRGKNADDDDHDQKLNEGKTLFVAHLKFSFKRLDVAGGLASARRPLMSATATFHDWVKRQVRLLKLSRCGIRSYATQGRKRRRVLQIPMQIATNET